MRTFSHLALTPCAPFLAQQEHRLSYRELYLCMPKSVNTGLDLHILKHKVVQPFTKFVQLSQTKYFKSPATEDTLLVYMHQQLKSSSSAVHQRWNNLHITQCASQTNMSNELKRCHGSNFKAKAGYEVSSAQRMLKQLVCLSLQSWASQSAPTSSHKCTLAIQRFLNRLQNV